jgi:hypothetical protein
MVARLLESSVQAMKPFPTGQQFGQRKRTTYKYASEIIIISWQSSYSWNRGQYCSTLVRRNEVIVLGTWHISRSLVLVAWLPGLLTYWTTVKGR